MNDSAKESLKNNLINGLLEAEMDNNRFIDYKKTNIAKFISGALKQKGEWLEYADVAAMINIGILSKKEIGSDEEPLGKLKDIFTKKEIEEITLSIIQELESVPASYTVSFPLPKVEIDKDIKFTENIALISEYSLSFIKSQKPHKTTFLKVKVSGYINGDINQATMKDATSKLKQFIQIAVLKKVFMEIFQPRNFSLIKGYSQTVHEAIIMREGIHGIDIMKIPLNLGMSSQLDKLACIRGSNDSESLIEILSPSAIIIDSHEKDVQSIKSALEWEFDAAAEDDETMKFIKTCIGLEAVLGEASENGGITERLADRCAYMLRYTPSQRQKTREDVKEVYKLRSKLVHGAVTKLKNSEKNLAIVGKAYLAAVIDSELRALVEHGNFRA